MTEWRDAYDPATASVAVILADLKHAISRGWTEKAARLAEVLATRFEPVEEVRAKSWSAARSTFVAFANRYRDAETSEAASILADIAPAAIVRAFYP